MHSGISFYSTLFILFFSFSLYAQNNTGFELLPNGKLFSQLKGNYFEPRTGLAYYPSTGFFKIDAGNAKELFRLTFADKSAFSFGGEFFVHALGLNVKQKRLPIDAADGYFGINFNYKNSTDDFKLRLRVLHNSAHLVDGHIERNSSYKSIIDFVQDFAELTALYSINSGRNIIDIYGGGSYKIVLNPKTIKRLTAHGGLQVNNEINDSFFGIPINMFFAYHFYLTSIPNYIGNNHIITGFRFGELSKSGVSIYLSYYAGAKLFNQYYNEREKEFSFGFYLE